MVNFIITSGLLCKIYLLSRELVFFFNLRLHFIFNMYRQTKESENLKFICYKIRKSSFVLLNQLFLKSFHPNQGNKATKMQGVSACERI